ncbi:MAG: ribbon-helix-helix protein, CopG family [Nitrosospira sp.]|nr:ribbon-helix-helix protein, CopG family [Nitrosospira sp.]
MSSLTIRLDSKLGSELERLATLRHQSKSEVARQLLRSGMARETLRLLHEELEPQARAMGWLTEEDILRDVS